VGQLHECFLAGSCTNVSAAASACAGAEAAELLWQAEWFCRMHECQLHELHELVALSWVVAYRVCVDPCGGHGALTVRPPSFWWLWSGGWLDRVLWTEQPF